MAETLFLWQCFSIIHQTEQSDTAYVCQGEYGLDPESISYEWRLTFIVNPYFGHAMECREAFFSQPPFDSGVHIWMRTPDPYYVQYTQHTSK